MLRSALMFLRVPQLLHPTGEHARFQAPQAANHKGSNRVSNYRTTGKQVCTDRFCDRAVSEPDTFCAECKDGCD